MEAGLQTPVPTDGHGVRIALAVKGWTQRDLARRIAMDETVLSRILSGTLRGTSLQWGAIWSGLSSEDPK